MSVRFDDRKDMLPNSFHTVSNSDSTGEFTVFFPESKEHS